MATDKKLSMRRRLKFTTLTLVTQMLLIALAITWLIHMVTIAINGSVYFVENNPYILWGEIAASVLITIFAIYILSIQIQRLGERRSTDRDRDRRR
jgi:ABC-type nickel/cobalt efflux system permease component RcnA